MIKKFLQNEYIQNLVGFLISLYVKICFHTSLWYVKNNTLFLYIKIIFVTAWVVVFPSSNIVNKIFHDIPSLPESLKTP